MPVPALYPLPANPTTGQPAIGAIGSRGVSSVLPATASGGSGGVNREVLKGLQDVAWSDDEVGRFSVNIGDGAMGSPCGWTSQIPTAT